MADDPEGSVRYDPATGAVAVRTSLPLDSVNPLADSRAWNIAGVRTSVLKGADFVADWPIIPPAILLKLPELTAHLTEVLALLETP